MSADLRRLATTVDLAPRRRPGRRLALLVAVAVVLGAAAARSADEELPPPAAVEDRAALAAPAEGTADTEADPAVVAEEEPTVQLPLLGRVGDLQLHVPAEDAVLVSYHEAAFIEAMPIVAVGTLLGNENPTRELLQEPGDGGIPFHVQVSRGRANGSTSAVDVVLDPSQLVRAPVSATVVEVRPYLLYGSHEDVRIELRPDGFPDRAVVLIHVEEPAVRAGDHVDVGDVLAARARPFPFSAVVDRQTAPERYGHVHIEVKRPQADG